LLRKNRALRGFGLCAVRKDTSGSRSEPQVPSNPLRGPQYSWIKKIIVNYLHLQLLT
jgi:hypothetical protein